MKFVTLFFASLFSLSVSASDLADQLISEYQDLKEWTQQQQPDGVVGELYPYVQMDGYIVMFPKEFDGEHERIRLYMPKDGEQPAFAVTYIKTKYIVENRMILRRTIGTEPTGWRNETVDFNTFEYLGSQGLSRPTIPKRAERIFADFPFLQP